MRNCATLWQEHLNASQYGLRKSFSLTDAVNKLNSIIENGGEDRHYVDSIFLDLTKAFGCVSHQMLLLKFKYYRFNPRSGNLLKSYLYEHTQSVFVNDASSKYLPILHGVLQGSVLGPIVFFNIHERYHVLLL